MVLALAARARDAARIWRGARQRAALRILLCPLTRIIACCALWHYHISPCCNSDITVSRSIFASRWRMAKRRRHDAAELKRGGNNIVAWRPRGGVARLFIAICHIAAAARPIVPTSSYLLRSISCGVNNAQQRNDMCKRRRDALLAGFAPHVPRHNLLYGGVTVARAPVGVAFERCCGDSARHVARDLLYIVFSMRSRNVVGGSSFPAWRFVRRERRDDVRGIWLPVSTVACVTERSWYAGVDLL